MLDLAIVNGTIVDGTGKPRFYGHVGVTDGRVVVVDRSSPPRAETVLDASGEVVAPGFIDMHSHSDLRLLEEPPPLAKLSQGITTEVLGQDGLGVAPVSRRTVEHLAGLTAGLLGPMPTEEWQWREFEEYLKVLGERRLPCNQAVLASHGPLRLMAVGADDRPATPAELDMMRELLATCMKAGAVGFSTGLIYPPAAYAPEEELVLLTRVVAEHDGVFVVHMRDEGRYLMEALQEVIRVSRLSGCRLHISHLQAHGEVNWTRLGPVLELIETARNEGLDVSCDRYPYLAGSTVLSAVLPTWVLSGGPEACLARLADPTERARIRDDFEKGLDTWNNRSISVGWRNIVVSWVGSEANKWAQGKSIREVARRLDTHPVDVVCDLLLQERLQVTMISHYGSEENLERIYSQPYSTVGTDGIFGGRPHPRLWGSFPRFFGHYVRERGLLTLEEAVRRTTSLPANILRLDSERGRLAPGYAADIVVFDPETIDGRATYERPERISIGLNHVVVNGQLAWSGKRGLGDCGGLVLHSQSEAGPEQGRGTDVSH